MQLSKKKTDYKFKLTYNNANIRKYQVFKSFCCLPNYVFLIFYVVKQNIVQCIQNSLQIISLSTSLLRTLHSTYKSYIISGEKTAALKECNISWLWTNLPLAPQDCKHAPAPGCSATGTRAFLPNRAESIWRHITAPISQSAAMIYGLSSLWLHHSKCVLVRAKEQYYEMYCPCKQTGITHMKKQIWGKPAALILTLPLNFLISYPCFFSKAFLVFFIFVSWFFFLLQKDSELFFYDTMSNHDSRSESI